MMLLTHDYQRVDNCWEIGEVEKRQHQGVFYLRVKIVLIEDVGNVHYYFVLVLEPVEDLVDFLLVTGKSLNQVVQLVPLLS